MGLQVASFTLRGEESNSLFEIGVSNVSDVLINVSAEPE